MVLIKYLFNIFVGMIFYYPVLIFAHKYFKPKGIPLWFYTKACFFAYDMGYRYHVKRLNDEIIESDEPF